MDIDEIKKKLEELLGRLHEVVLTCSPFNFFHPNLPPSLVSIMHNSHEFFYDIHLALLKRDWEELTHQRKKMRDNLHSMEKVQDLLKNSNEHQMILDKLIQLEQDLIVYMDLLCENRKQFEKKEDCWDSEELINQHVFDDDELEEERRYDLTHPKITPYLIPPK